MKNDFSTIGELIRHWATATPEAIALVSPDRKPLTYRMYGEQARYVGEFFETLDLGRGNRIAVAVPNGAEAVLCYASVCAHATAAPLNPAYTFEEFCSYLKNLSVDAVMVMRGVETAARAAAATLDLLTIELDPDRTASAGLFRLSAQATSRRRQAGSPTLDDLALVVQTSGTTSQPKIIPLTHRNVVARAIQENDWYGVGRDDRVLCLNPLYHNSGLKQCVFEPLQSGGSTVAAADFGLSDFLDKLANYQPTWCTGSATFFHEIARSTDPRDGALHRHHLRFFRSGSTRLLPSVAGRIEEGFGVPILNAYSSSEAGLMTSNPLPPGLRRSETVGMPIGTAVAILNDEGNELPPGAEGEVAARGPTVMTGYEAAPQANLASFSNGWFRTGDMGCFDVDGYLHLNGRIKETINRGGEKIFPAEIEAALETHDDVKEAAAFGVPHPTLNEVVVAAVVPASAAITDAKHLKHHARSLLSRTKVPTKIFVVDELPRNSNGKLLRNRMREQFARPLIEVTSAMAGDANSIPVGIVGVIDGCTQT